MVGISTVRYLPTPSPAAGLGDRHRFRPPRSFPAVCQARRIGSVPKLDPFSRSRIERGLKDPPFLRKTENDLSEYCCTLEGDECYVCWKAYFELKEMERTMPKDDVEKLVRDAGDIDTLISCLHDRIIMKEIEKRKVVHSSEKEVKNTEMTKEIPRPFPVPDGIPKTAEELEEEESALMPDSAHTRLLRRMGRMPAWYTPLPDHETD